MYGIMQRCMRACDINLYVNVHIIYTIYIIYIKIFYTTHFRLILL